MTTYPTAIYADYPPFTGWSVIMRGHNLTPEQIQEQVTECNGRGSIATVTREHLFTYKPRVIHCGNHGAVGCDQDGDDWHSHWFETNADREDTRFTVAGYEYERAAT